MRLPALLLLCALVGVVVSPHWPTSLQRLLVLLAGVALFYTAAALIRTPRHLRAAALSLVVLGAWAAALLLVSTRWAVGSLVGGWPNPALRFPLLVVLPRVGGAAVGEGLNPRVTAAITALLLPLPLALALWGRGRAWRLAGALAALCVATHLLLSQSPQGLLGVALGLGLMLALWRPWTLLVGAPLAGAAAFTWFRYRWWLPEALAGRLEVGLAARLAIWPRALLMLRDVPFTGIGLGVFPRVDPFYRVNPGLTYHAHSTYLQTGLEVGVVGLVAFLALMALYFLLAARGYRAARDPNARAALLGLAGCGAAYLGYGLADSLWIGRQGALPLWIMLGTVAGAAGGLTPAPPPALSLAKDRPRRGRLALTALVVSLALLAYPIWCSALLADAAVLIARPPWAGPEPAPARLDRGQDLARRALDLWARNSRAHALLGEIAWLRGDPEGAMAAYGRAVELDPADPLAHGRLGDLYAGQGDPARAVAHYRAAGAAELLLQRAYQARSAEEWPQAVGWYRLAAAVAPADERALRGLANALRSGGQLEEAEARFRDYVARFPELPSGYAGLADLLLRRDQVAPAVQVYREGLAAAGPDAALYLGLSRAHQREGDRTAAVEAALAALELRPDLRPAWAQLGSLYEAQGRPDDALGAYLRAVGETEDHTAWVSLMGAGRLLLQGGAPGEAAGHLARAATISRALGTTPSAVARVYALLGDALGAAGRPPDAARAYREALSLDPENAAAAKGLAALEGDP